MRIAFFSPLPPAKSGIADYSAALLGSLQAMADVTAFIERPPHFSPESFDLCVYQIGNNGDHAFAYEMALEHPGVVVLHEANLHHLLAEITIRRGDWDAYMREVEYDGGPAALPFAQRVRALEVGPDYEGVPMLRRLLSRAKGVIAHSHYVAGIVRESGFSGPVGVIPHGAWLVQPDRLGYRSRLGLPDQAPLIGTFGFLKPYKRIAESLRAFRRLIQVQPDARMVLVGESHPDFPVDSLIRSLKLGAHVRLFGYTAIEDFNGYLNACDIVLNLRYPTVGETSGTLLRALGMGKAVIVSDVGAFAEYPDRVCLKVPVDRAEEDTLFEYLALLTSRPELARSLGSQARAWVITECSWDKVAARYLAFLQAVADGRPWQNDRPAAITLPAAEELTAPPTPVPQPALDFLSQEALEQYVRTWANPDPDSRAYMESHITRLARTLALTPPGSPQSRVLEMGAYFQITAALRTRLGYGEVRGCYYGETGTTEHREALSQAGEHFVCDVELFDAEKDRFPYADGYFDTVLCCELIEHLVADPMHMMREINRILKPGGCLLMTTPNVCSLRAVAGILNGYHPGFYASYSRPKEDGTIDPRHSREYAPRELAMIFQDAGFEVTLLTTGPFREEPRPEFAWVRHLLARYELTEDLRGEDIYCLGRKAGAPRERYPDWLYDSSTA